MDRQVSPLIPLLHPNVGVQGCPPYYPNPDPPNLTNPYPNPNATTPTLLTLLTLTILTLLILTLLTSHVLLRKPAVLQHLRTTT